MSDQQKKPDLGLLEEDDEFEEFPAEGITSFSCLVVEDILNSADTRAEWSLSCSVC